MTPPVSHGPTAGQVREAYPPLDRSINSIRLLRILPTSTAELIDCEVRTSTTADSYVCLSYCWGEPSVHLVRLNGFHVAVRDNLHEFLQEARRRNTNHWFWIDALCINQINVAERNHQVMQMAAIYRSADEVIVWLGTKIAYLPEVHGSTLGPGHDEFFARIAKLPEQEIPPTPITPQVLRSRWPLGTPLSDNGQLFIDGVEMFWLCNHPYWSRVWILQEFILAKRLVIWWGQDGVSAERLLHAVSRNYYDCEVVLKNCEEDKEWDTRFRDLLYVRGSSGRLLVEKSLQLLDKVHRFNRFRRIFTDNGNVALPSLSHAIQQLKPSQCTDDRDRVYALLSLASNTADFLVDYEESFAALYDRLLRHTKLHTRPNEFKLEAIRLATYLGMDAVQMCRSFFSEPGSERWRWEATFVTYCHDPYDLYDRGYADYRTEDAKIWALHPPRHLSRQRSSWRQRFVSQVFEMSRDGSAQDQYVCAMCKGRINSSAATKSQKLVRAFEGSELWLQATAASVTNKLCQTDPNISALRAVRVTDTFSRIELAFEDNPAQVKMPWMVFGQYKSSGNAYAILLPSCRYPGCILSKERSLPKTENPSSNIRESAVIGGAVDDTANWASRMLSDLRSKVGSLGSWSAMDHTRLATIGAIRKPLGRARDMHSEKKMEKHHYWPGEIKSISWPVDRPSGTPTHRLGSTQIPTNHMRNFSFPSGHPAFLATAMQ